MMWITIFFLISFNTFVTTTPIPSAPNSIELHTRLNISSSSCSTPPDQRSIQDIVWGCLATIFACAWLAVHPNMPSARAKWWQIGLTRLELMSWTVLAPELVIYWAVRQWIGARQVQKHYRGRGWTKTHGYFIQMGGFVLFKDGTNKEVLSPKRFADLLKRGEIDFPNVSEEEIQDRSKGDWLSKSLVIVQTTWFIAQFLARISLGLTVSELELVTLAFAALNGFMYFFWWNKPLDVRTPIVVPLLNPAGRKEDLSDANHPGISHEDVSDEKPYHNSNHAILNINKRITQSLSRMFKSFTSDIKAVVIERCQLLALAPDNILLGRERVPIFFASAISSKEDRLITLPVALIGIIFGAIHCAGWNFSFPSTVERRLWRISSLVIIGSPTILMVALTAVSMFVDVFQLRETKYSKKIFRSRMAIIITASIVCVVISIYVLARLFLIIEAFATLRNLPPSTKSVVQWTSFLPHV